MENELMNVIIVDKGRYTVCVNGLAVCAFDTLGDAWRHIEWMVAVARQEFTVGYERVSAKEWVNQARARGCFKR